MWIKRLIHDHLSKLPTSYSGKIGLPTVRVLLGPRQVGKTSLLDRLPNYELISFDELTVRDRANQNPGLFLDQFKGPVILDEASYSPNLFPEIKKRVDEAKRKKIKNEQYNAFDYWITGSNQTIMAKYIQESLAGRADFYYLNTLSIKEINKFDLSDFCMKGGWPELYSNTNQNYRQYINNLITTFIEKDIVGAAGIEKKSAFTKTVQFIAGNIGQMLNYSNLASNVGANLSTVQSWTLVLEQNGLIKILQPYFTNINKRLIKTPKVFFEDVSLAVRLQGWNDFHPLFLSPYFGSIVENIAYSELSRFFINNNIEKKIYYLRNKEKTEIDFLIELPNKKFISAEVKTTPRDYTNEQLKLLDSLKINIVEKLILIPGNTKQKFKQRVVSFKDIFDVCKDLLKK